MQPPDLIRLFVAPLHNLNLRYMITGAVASVIYGEPRLTRDVDLVVDLRAGDAERLTSAFSPDAFYVPPLDVVEEEARRSPGGHFNLIHLETALKADCYVAGEDPLHGWAMGRRVQHDVGGEAVWVAPIEYVILRKLQWHRETGASRHLEDVRSMLRISGLGVDSAALGEWVSRLSLEKEWRVVAADLAAN